MGEVIRGRRLFKKMTSRGGAYLREALIQGRALIQGNAVCVNECVCVWGGGACMYVRACGWG